MKLVPLADRVVLKQLVAEETTKSGIVLPGQNKEKPPAGRSYCSRPRRSCGRQGNQDGSKGWRSGYLLQICWN